MRHQFTTPFQVILMLVFGLVHSSSAQVPGPGAGSPGGLSGQRFPIPSSLVLTVDGSIGPVTVSPLLRAGFWFEPDGRMARREVRIVTIAWTVPGARVPTTPVVPGITLHVTDYRDTGICSRNLLPRDLPPSVDLRRVGLTGTTTLDFAGAQFRPGRTYYVRGCVFGLPLSLGGGEVGLSTNLVEVRIDWDVPTGERVDLSIENQVFGVTRIEPLPDRTQPAQRLRAHLNIRSTGRLADAVRNRLDDRLVIDVYVDGGLEPVHREVVTGAARTLAAGPTGPGFGAFPVTVEHPVPTTLETHLVQYVINADGAIPESNYENDHASMRFGYLVLPDGSVSFAHDRSPDGPFRIERVWSPPDEQGDDHVWVYVQYAGGPYGILCPGVCMRSRDAANTPDAADPIPSLHVWLDSTDTACIGARAFEPTPAQGPGGLFARLIDFESRVRRIKRYYCYAYAVRVPFSTTTVTAEERLHGVSTRRTAPLGKVWSTATEPYTHVADLTGEITLIEFLGGRPALGTCGYHPRVRFRVRNRGAIASPPSVAAIAITAPAARPGDVAPPCAGIHDTGLRVPPREYAHGLVDVRGLSPGESVEQEYDFPDSIQVALGAVVRVDVDALWEVVEADLTNNSATMVVTTR